MSPRWCNVYRSGLTMGMLQVQIQLGTLRAIDSSEKIYLKSTILLCYEMARCRTLNVAPSETRLAMTSQILVMRVLSTAAAREDYCRES